MSIHRFLSALALLLLAVGLCPARADDAEAVKDKLFQAKKTYDAEVQKFKKATTDWLDKREDDARKAGNRKLVDQIKAERTMFEKTGESPQMIPATIREPVTAARNKLDKAYITAVKDYLRLKLDDEARVTEKEQQEFQFSAAFLFGKRSYLVAMKHSDLKVEIPSSFETNGTYKGVKLKRDGEEIPHSIFLHPPTKGSSEVSYPLAGKKVAFRTAVAIIAIGDDARDPATATTFEVLGDGQSLWMSKPATKANTYETCELQLDKVKKLTLRVACPGPNTCARAVWYEPILAE